MTVTVKTFARLAEAANALSSERGARFLAGGTLVMRAVNEADPAIETILRSTDPSFIATAVTSGRIELGAGVTMAAILRERELAFLHPVARAVGGPAVREAATIGGNLFAPSPYGDFATALLALDATVMASRARKFARIGRRFQAAGDRGVPVREGHARPSQGLVGPLDRSATAAGERPSCRCSDRLWCDGPNATARQGNRARARGPLARSRCDRAGPRGRRQRDLTDG